MIEEYIRLVTFTTAIYMQEDGTAIRITLAVFLIERIYFLTALAKAGNLVQRDRSTHTSFTLTVIKVLIVTDTVFGILNNNINFSAFLHQIPGKTKSDIISIFILMQFHASYPANSTGIRATMPTHHVETRTFEAVSRHFNFSKAFSEKRFANCFVAGTGRRI